MANKTIASRKQIVKTGFIALVFILQENITFDEFRSLIQLSNECHNDPQFPLNFGDGVLGDIQIDLIDFRTDGKGFVFSTHSDGYIYNSATSNTQITPLLGFYVTQNPEQVMSFLSWMRYFGSTSFAIQTIQAIAISADQQKVVVAFGPTFALATLDLLVGGIYYSGTAGSLYTNYAVPSQGIAMDTNGFTYVAVNQAGTSYLKKFDIDFCTTIWSNGISSTESQAVLVRPTDNYVYLLENFFFSPFSVQNSILITEITPGNVGTRMLTAINNPNIQANQLFKHFHMKDQYMGGCFDMGTSSHASGYFYYNSQTNQVRVGGHALGSITTCLGFYIFSDTDLGYFYRLGVQNTYRLLKISNALTATTIQLYKVDYSTATKIPTVSKFVKFVTTDYYMIGSFTSASGKKVGLIEFSDSVVGSYSCYSTPQEVYFCDNSMDQFTTSTSTTSVSFSGSTSNQIVQVQAGFLPSALQKKSTYCSADQMIQADIVPPVSYPATTTCALGQTCTVSFSSPYTISPTSLQTCQNGPINKLYFSVYDGVNFVIQNQLMTSNIFTLTFTPTVPSTTHYIFSSLIVNGFSLDFESSISYVVNAISCTLFPPTTWPTTFICYHNELCSIKIPTAYSMSDPVCAADIKFTLTDIPTGLVAKTDLSFTSNVFNYVFTPIMSQNGLDYQYTITAKAYQTGTTNVIDSDSTVTPITVKIRSKCVLNAPTFPYSMGNIVRGDPTQIFTLAAFIYTPSYCATGINYALSLPAPAAVPSFISIANTLPTLLDLDISVNPQQVSFYIFTITANTVGGISMTATMVWELTISDSAFIPPPNTAPYFANELGASIEIKCNEKTDFLLPSIVDDEEDDVTAQIIAVSSVQSMTALKSDYSMITFNPVCRTNQTVDLQVKLTDNNALSSKSRTYTLQVSTLYIPPVSTSKSKPAKTSQTVNDYEDSSDSECFMTSKLTTQSMNVKQDSFLDVDTCMMIFPDIEIFADEKSIYELPPKMMTDPKSVIEVRTREINKFLQLYQQGKLTLVPESDDFGNYTVTVRMIDRSSMQLVASSMFRVIVKASNGNLKNGGCPVQSLKDCNPKIQSVSMQGEVTVIFPFGLRVFASDFYTNITKTLGFTFIPANVNDKISTSNISGWEVTSFKSQTLIIQLFFKNPLEISAQDGFPDKLDMQFLANDYFMSYDQKYRVQVGLTLNHDLPQQFDASSSASKKTQVVFQAMEKGMTSSLVANFLLAAFMGIAMKQIWGIINTLQILTFMPLMVPQLPSNLQVCLQILQDVSNLNVVPKSVTDWFLDVLSYIQNQDTSPDLGVQQDYYQSSTYQPEENGFRRRLQLVTSFILPRILNNSTEEVTIVEVSQPEGKTKLMDNIAYIILGVFVICLILLFVFACARLSQKYPMIQKVLVSIKNKIVFGIFITTVTKGYLKLTLSFIKQLSPEEASFESEDQQSQSWAPVIFFCLFSMIPMASYFFLMFNQGKLQEDEFRNKWGALYTNLNTEKVGQYTFNVWFMTRRFIYAISIAGFFTSTSMINVMLQIIMSFQLIIYIAVVKPFTILRDNLIEIINEFTILISFYLTIGLITDDSLMSGELKYEYGFFMIAIVLMNVMVNFSIFIGSLVQQLIAKFKLAYSKYQHNKKVRIEQKEQEPMTDERRAELGIQQSQEQFNGSHQKLNFIDTSQQLAYSLSKTDDSTPNMKFTVNHNTESYFEYLQRKKLAQTKKGVLNADYVLNTEDTENAPAPRQQLDLNRLVSKMSANGEGKVLAFQNNQDFKDDIYKDDHPSTEYIDRTPMSENVSRYEFSPQKSINRPLGLGNGLNILQNNIAHTHSNSQTDQTRKIKFEGPVPGAQQLFANGDGVQIRARADSEMLLADRIRNVSNILRDNNQLEKSFS